MTKLTRLFDDMLIEEEVRKVHSENVQGEQSIMVQHDMKAWALDSNIWASASYDDIVSAHAASRGWTQDNFTGMEIV